MKKYAPVIFIFIFFAVPGGAEGIEYIHAMPIFSASAAFEVVPKAVDDELLNEMFGLGIRIPFLFEEFKEDSFFMLAPTLTAEYSFFYNLLRIRTGVHVGKLDFPFFAWFDEYIGVSGIFMQDFTNNVSLAGISPEIGFEFSLILFSTRCQLQYEWYSDSTYNRIVLTILFGILIPPR